MNEKFDYGDEIKIKSTAPIKYRPGAFGAVCGFIKIEFEELSKKYQENLGTILCTVEFEDGETLQIPEEYLTKIDE